MCGGRTAQLRWMGSRPAAEWTNHWEDLEYCDNMKSGTCPKCESSSILRSRKGGWPGLHQIHIATLDVALVECLICSDCGYVETYVPSQLDRRKMLRSFERFEPDAEDSRQSGADEPAPRDGR